VIRTGRGAPRANIGNRPWKRRFGRWYHCPFHPGRTRDESDRGMRILDILSPSSVKVPLASTEKHAILDEMVDLLAANGLCPEPDAVKKAVWERETIRTTGIGMGLAIPHGKCASVPGLVLAIGKPAKPVEFGSLDKKPVELIILLVSNPEKKDDHIQALGKISKIMTSPEFRQRAYTAQSAVELFGLFREAES